MVSDVFGIVGEVIAGAYEVEAVVAQGGFAVVYRAQHKGFSAPVALKCLKLPQKLDINRQEAFLEQFRAEGELLFELSASIPTVVRPLHVDALTTADGTFVPYMVLEWLDGETLDKVVERRSEQNRSPLPIKKLTRMLAPVAEALARAHNFTSRAGSVSIVHCDIKPENIFIARVAGEDVVKILDFGVAKAQSVASQVAGGALQPSRGVSSFTPAFAAPEQWAPGRFGQAGPWTDVWGFALTMVEALVGHPVLEGEPAQMMATALDRKRRPTPKALGVDVPDSVERVFARALSIDPRERQPSMGVFWDELSVALGLKKDLRDSRREAGSVPREEVVEAALPPAARFAARRSVGPSPAVRPPRPPPRDPTRATLATDDPFSDADQELIGGLEQDDDLVAGVSSLPRDLEAAIPSAPPPEAPAAFGREASLPSIPDELAPMPAATDPFVLDSPPPPRSAPERPAPARARSAEPSELDDEEPGQVAAPERSKARAPARIELDDPRGEVGARAIGSVPIARAEPMRPAGFVTAADRGESPRSGPSVWVWSLGLIAGAIVLGIGARMYQSSTGQRLGAGPVDAMWVAGALLAVGVGLVFYRLLPKDR